MKLYSVFLLFLCSLSLACEINLPCIQCLEQNCLFVLSKNYKTFCVTDLENVTNKKMVVKTARSCGAVAIVIERESCFLFWIIRNVIWETNKIFLFSGFSFTRGQSLDEIKSTSSNRVQQPTKAVKSVASVFVLGKTNSNSSASGAKQNNHITTKAPPTKNNTQLRPSMLPGIPDTVSPATTPKPKFIPHPFIPMRNESYYQQLRNVSRVNKTTPATTTTSSVSHNIQPVAAESTQFIHKNIPIPQSQPASTQSMNTGPAFPTKPVNDSITTHLQSSTTTLPKQIVVNKPIPFSPRVSIMNVTTAATTTSKPYMQVNVQTVKQLYQQPTQQVGQTINNLPSNPIHMLPAPLTTRPTHHHQKKNPAQQAVVQTTTQKDKCSIPAEITDVKDIFRLVPSKFSCEKVCIFLLLQLHCQYKILFKKFPFSFFRVKTIPFLLLMSCRCVRWIEFHLEWG